MTGARTAVARPANFRPPPKNISRSSARLTFKSMCSKGIRTLSRVDREDVRNIAPFGAVVVTLMFGWSYIYVQRALTYKPLFVFGVLFVDRTQATSAACLVIGLSLIFTVAVPLLGLLLYVWTVNAYKATTALLTGKKSLERPSLTFNRVGQTVFVCCSYVAHSVAGCVTGVLTAPKALLYGKAPKSSTPKSRPLASASQQRAAPAQEKSSSERNQSKGDQAGTSSPKGKSVEVFTKPRSNSEPPSPPPPSVAAADIRKRAHSLTSADKKLETSEDDNICKVCMTSKINTVMVPCGHLVCCAPCGKKLHAHEHSRFCPICRARLNQVLQVYSC